jgi:hypothetical protein
MRAIRHRPQCFVDICMHACMQEGLSLKLTFSVHILHIVVVTPGAWRLVEKEEKGKEVKVAKGTEVYFHILPLNYLLVLVVASTSTQ